MRVQEILFETLNGIWWNQWRDDGSGYGDCDIYCNPSRQQFLRLLKNSEQDELRGCLLDDGTVLVWDAYYATHDDIDDQFSGVKRTKVVNLWFYDAQGVVGYNRMKGFGWNDNVPMTVLKPVLDSPQLHIMMGGSFELEHAY